MKLNKTKSNARLEMDSWNKRFIRRVEELTTAWIEDRLAIDSDTFIDLRNSALEMRDAMDWWRV